MNTSLFEGLECQSVNSFNLSIDQCAFVKSIRGDACFDEESWINYSVLFYCTIGATSKILPLVVSAALLVFFFLGLGTTAEEFMCPSLESIAKSMRLSENIAGVTFLALGNGAPDIFSSIAGIRQSRPELVIGELFGGGIFVTTVVVGAILLTGSFKVMQRPICRDMLFYAIASFATWSICYRGTIYLWESIAVLIVYVIYIATVVIGRIVYTRQKASLSDSSLAIASTASMDEEGSHGLQVRTSSQESVFTVSKALKSAGRRRLSSNLTSCDQLPVHAGSTSVVTRFPQVLHFLKKLVPFEWKELRQESWWNILLAFVKVPIQVALIVTVPAVSNDEEHKGWSRFLNCIHVVTGPLMIALSAGAASVTLNGFPCLAIVALVGLVLAVVVFLTSSPDHPPVYFPAFSLLAFVVSCCWTYSFATEVVSLLETIGFMLDVSEAILGLTVLAWGNSVGDLVANLAMARHGYQRMAISACFGGPLLNLLLGIGIPYSMVLPETADLSIKIEYSSMFTLLLIVMMLALAVTIAIFISFGFRSLRYHGFLLIAIYFIYLIFAMLLELHVI